MAKKKINYKNFINCLSTSLIKNGKKKKFAFFFKMFQFITKNKRFFKHLFLLIFVISRIRPLLEIKTIRKGSQHYLFPMPFYDKNRSLKIAIRFMAKSIKMRREYILYFKVKKEVYSLLSRKGFAWKHYKESQKVISKTILYAHYRWR